MSIENLKAAYREALPERWRRAIRSLLSVFDRDDYNTSFFNYVDSLQASSHPIMAATIAHRFKLENVIDIGCGSGGLLHSLREVGNIPGSGLEYSKRGRELCMQKGLQVEFADLTEPLAIDPKHDLVCCFEVAEHLPEAFADQLVASLTSGPNHVVFSAAIPGQGGNDHVNEQPNSYWIEKFETQDFKTDKTMTEEIRAEWRSGEVVDWFANNVMVFCRSK